MTSPAGPPAEPVPLPLETTEGEVVSGPGRLDDGPSADPTKLLLQVLANVQVNTSIIPPASAIEPWERLVPGSAKQFLDQALTQSNHRQSLERKAIENDHTRAMAGISAGRWVVLGALALAGLAVWKGEQLVAAAITVGGLASLAAVFVIGKHESRSDLLRKMISMGRAAEGDTESPDSNKRDRGSGSRPHNG